MSFFVAGWVAIALVILAVVTPTIAGATAQAAEGTDSWGFEPDELALLDTFFKAFPAEQAPIPVPRGTLDLSGHEEEYERALRRTFPVDFKEELLKEPNFAGTLRVVTHGCGTACWQHVIINLVTARVEFSVQSNQEAAFRADSRLLVTRYRVFIDSDALGFPYVGERTRDTFYVWRHGRMEPLWKPYY